MAGGPMSLGVPGISLDDFGVPGSSKGAISPSYIRITMNHDGHPVMNQIGQSNGMSVVGSLRGFCC